MSPKFPAVTSVEIVSVLKKIGFKLKRQSGTSHAIYFRGQDGKRTTVPIHSGKVVKRKTLKSIIAGVGLTTAEFAELTKQ